MIDSKINVEQKFKDLRHQLDQFDTSAMQTRIQNNLHTAWQQSHQLTKPSRMKSWNWNIFTYAIGGTSLAALALITTIVINPTNPTRQSDLLSEPEAVTDFPTTTSSNSTIGFDALTTSDSNSEAQQILSESVNLAITTKTDPLDVIHQLRTATTNHQGKLVSISYYNDTGIISLKLPPEQLTAFEDQLKQLDANHTVVVNSYNVTDVTTGTPNEDTNQQQLIDVTITVTHYQSFWEGNYTQYDRSTLSGSIKYEAGQALYSLIHSSSKVLRFFIWLAVYSIIFVPAFLLLRAVVHFIIRKLQKL